MNQISDSKKETGRQELLLAALHKACDTIAPTWPLDKFIAVNPLWERRASTFSEAAARLKDLSGSNLYMSYDYYRSAYENEEFSTGDLHRALSEENEANRTALILSHLYQNEDVHFSSSRNSFPLLSDIVEESTKNRALPPCSETLLFHISQFCASYFDRHQAEWRGENEQGLYKTYLSTLINDHGISLLIGDKVLLKRAAEIPSEPFALFEKALTQLDLPESGLADYFEALLLRVSGWAAWCAYLKWQAKLEEREKDNTILDLLAIRLIWELLLDDGQRGIGSNFATWRQLYKKYYDAGNQKTDYRKYFLRAHEISYQNALNEQLVNSRDTEKRSPSRADFQAAFCIDVRSEVVRRALENCSDTITTLGFAGFFGVPISFSPIGTNASWPQLPGLIAPGLKACDSSGNHELDHQIASARKKRLATSKNALLFEKLPASAFSFVETMGITYLKDSLLRITKAYQAKDPSYYGLSKNESKTLKPELFGLELSEQAALCEKILRAMSLTENFARLVALIGHTSQTANNPYAAGLNCGACCGQSGERNARIVASLLNKSEVRRALIGKGITIPDDTLFIAGLHNTTTEEISLFDDSEKDIEQSKLIAELKEILSKASEVVRVERASALGLTDLTNSPQKLKKAFIRRALDWSQTRPEWGLANNACFIAAPRVRTKHINLSGRSFLHDYDYEKDEDGSILELIMTAPMVVAHWINMQYYASTVDNKRYGTGNKILHNVVGGKLGVFEGNGGDLRVGLSTQSVHDGKKWMHTPLRLSVYLEAPPVKIQNILENHPEIQELIENKWLYLFCIDPEENKVMNYKERSWISV